MDEIKDNKIFVGAFEWRIEFPEVLDEDGRFVGFDCVIGNPPYIQLQKMGTDADTLQKMNYETYERTGDIYCLFYEMGMKLLKPGALLSFITSNGWMKSAYGKSLRTMLTSLYQPSLLIDFAGYRVFDSATVDANILSVIKSNTHYETIAYSIKKDNFEVEKLSDYVQTHSMQCPFGNEPWSILSDIELRIKQKVETIGVPLSEWNVQIYRGVLTGYNDAFIISSQKRDEILYSCIDEEERKRTEELIRPILRGRDIRRYGYNWADLWLINTHNGIRGEMERIHIEEYPAIKQHLDNYWNKIEPRADQGETAYNLRNCAYLDEFSKTKIVWIELSDESKFAICDDLVPLNTVFFLTGEHLHHILGMLNSKLLHWYFTTCLGTSSGVGTNRWLKYTIEQLPLVPYSDDTLSQLVIERLSPETEIDKCEERIDSLICELYGLSLDEMSFIIGSC